MNDLIRSNLFELDEHTSHKVLLTYVGNPKEVGSVYDALRDPGLRERDEEDAKAYFDEQKEGLGADYIRRRELHKLISEFGIDRDQLPCIVFFANPPCAPPAIFKIHPEWILTPSTQREFGDSLIGFFKSNELDRLVLGCKTNVELTRAFERLINGHIESRLGVELDLDREYAKDTPTFQKQGKTWLAVYAGARKSIGDSVGMAYIRQLLQNPGRVTHAAVMRGAVAGEENTPTLGSAGAVLDAQALREYRDRIAEIDEKLAEAETNNDLARKGSLNEERAALYAEVGRATGLHGKNREASSDRERARQSVSAAIHRALRAIKKEHEPLWQHLHNSLKIGESLSYQPDQPTSWTT